MFALFLSYGTSSVIMTQRGVVNGVGYNYNGNENAFYYDKWLLEEEIYQYDRPPYNYIWSVSSDPRFPYGVFISHARWDELVWDIKGYNANPNAPICLYRKKNSEIETKKSKVDHDQYQ